ncbi:MAG: sigma 54-interacting transcriptional regulator [Pseudomonadota bacterium]
MDESMSFLGIDSPTDAEQATRRDYPRMRTQAADTAEGGNSGPSPRESTTRYKELVMAIPDGVVAYDPQGRVTYVNDGFVQIFGWTAEELVGRSIDFVPPEEAERTREAWEKTFEGEKVLFETRRRTKSGQLLDIQLRTAILHNLDGTIAASIVIHRDITDRRKAHKELQRAHDDLEKRVEKRTRELAATNERLRKEIADRRSVEERLKESEYRQRMLVENAPLGIIWCDLAGRVFQANQNLLTILGLSSLDEAHAINVFTFPPLVTAGISAEMKIAVESEGTRVCERPYPAMHGETVQLRVHIVPTRDGAGGIDGVQAIVEDITERKKAESALCESEDRFRAVFETAQDCIFIKDRDFVYSHVNQAFLKALERSEDQVVGKTDNDLFPMNEADYIRDLELRVMEGQVMEASYNLSTRRQPKTFHCIRVPLRQTSGETIGICGIARDVTEQKALERRCPHPVGQFGSVVMEATLEHLRLAAASDSIVLLLGESGSGKDFLAKFLHDHSRRSGGPYFAINCAAPAASVAESEFFGHEPGSFTGSRGRKRGLLEMAEGGTLLLNEIGELSQELQAKLLTFLDTHSFTRVGGEKNVKVNTRIVAATNRNLESEMAAGRFRQDLFYRLNVMAVRVPSLRERKEDIPFLTRDLVESLSRKLGRAVPPAVDDSALEVLAQYEWPGNVRELRNILERALILCRSDVIKAEHVSVPKTRQRTETNEKEIPVSVNLTDHKNMNEALESAKRLMIVSALRRCKGNVSAAARLLGISRDALRYHKKALEI